MPENRVAVGIINGSLCSSFGLVTNNSRLTKITPAQFFVLPYVRVRHILRRKYFQFHAFIDPVGGVYHIPLGSMSLI